MKTIISLVVLLACASVAFSRTFTIYAGLMSGDYMFAQWYPSDITVKTGDVLRFVANDNELHNAILVPAGVTDLAATYPLFIPAGDPTVSDFVYGPWAYGLGDGTFNGTQAAASQRLSKTEFLRFYTEWTVTITATSGNWTFFCPYHLPTMIGTIRVTDAATYPTEVQVDAAAQTAMQTALGTVSTIANRYGSNSSTPLFTTTASGARIYTLHIGFADAATGLMYNKFYPSSNLAIRAGDTVSFDFTTNQFNGHIVGFGVTRAFEVKNATTGIWTLAGTAFRPANFNPAAPTTVSYTSGFINSGAVLGSFSPVFMVPQPNFNVTFPNAGTYPYECSIHVPLGMTGTITATGTSATTTGNSAVTTSTSSAATVQFSAVFALVAFVAALML